MRKLVLGALIMSVAVSPAFAGKIVCNLTDTQGSAITYAFKGNSVNSDGSFGGTFVEDAFVKNGRVTVSPVGGRPVWMYVGNVAGGVNMYPRETPGWKLSEANGRVGLYHGGRFIAGGSCSFDAGVTAGNVADQGVN